MTPYCERLRPLMHLCRNESNLNVFVLVDKTQHIWHSVHAFSWHSCDLPHTCWARTHLWCEHQTRMDNRRNVGFYDKHMLTCSLMKSWFRSYALQNLCGLRAHYNQSWKIIIESTRSEKIIIEYSAESVQLMTPVWNLIKQNDKYCFHSNSLPHVCITYEIITMSHTIVLCLCFAFVHSLIAFMTRFAAAVSTAAGKCLFS